MGGRGSGSQMEPANPEPLADDRELWEQQPKESEPAFEAFTLYRDGGASRSCAAVGRQLGKSKTLLTAWSSRWSWVKRARAWDALLDARKRNSQLEAIDEMKSRHVQLGKAMQAAGGLVVKDIVERIQRGERVTVTPNEARQLVEAGAKLERLTVGEPDTIQSIEVSGELDEGESRAKAKLLALLGRSAGGGAGEVIDVETTDEGNNEDDDDDD